MPLHLHHLLQARPGGSVRGELREEVPDHLQAGGGGGDGEEVLPARPEGLQRAGAGAVQDGVRVLLHHQVCREGPGPVRG